PGHGAAEMARASRHRCGTARQGRGGCLMSRVGVLTAAAVLHDFTPAQLAAWCEEDVDTVVGLLTDASDLFRRLPDAGEGGAGEGGAGGQRWQVIDAQVLRHAITVESRALPGERADHLAAAYRVSGNRLLRGPAARLRMAEETLMDCAEEPSALARRIMVDSA